MPGYKIQDGEIHIFGETSSTYFLFELKYNRYSEKEVFKQARERIRHFFQSGKSILVAGANFVRREGEHCLTKSQLGGWQAELLDESGTLLRRYSHETFPLFKEWAETTTSNTLQEIKETG